MNKLSNRKISLNLFLINAFIYISFSQYNPFLAPYFAKAGINAVEIGILLTIGPISSILIQPIWAIISDRTGKRREVLSVVVLGSALSIFSYYIGKTFLSFFIASTLLAVFSTSIVPLSDAIILRSANKNQLDFSKIRMGGTVGYAIFVIFAGIIVKRNSDLAFIMGFIGFLILFIFVRLLPKDDAIETLPKKEYLHMDRETKPRGSLLHIFESKQIYFLLAFAFISQVGLSFVFSFQSVYMVHMGFSTQTIGITGSIAAISELPVLFLMNRVLNKVSPTKITILACFILALRIITVTGESLFFVILSQALHGLSFMTIYFCCAVFISKNVKPENQSKGQSILALIQTGLGSIVGNILGGYLVDSYGLKTAFVTMTILIITVAGLTALLQYIYQRKQKTVINE
ncbi:MAG: ProP12 [Firmicutes bacterium]|nr:ProP12 [Bacillota bacterium]